MVSYLSVTVLQHRRKACFCCCHPRVSSVGLTLTGIAWERNLKMVSDQSLSSASKPFLTHPLVRTSPITHPPQSGRGVFALVRKQCCVITPPRYHTPAAGLSCKVLITRGSFDTTPAYKSAPGHNIFEGQKFITAVCFRWCSTVMREFDVA